MENQLVKEKTKQDHVKDWHDKLLVYLLEFRKQNPELTFWLRQRDKGNRLSDGYWFQGNDNYIFLSFWNRSGGTNMTRSMGFLVWVNDDGTATSGMEVVYNGETDKELISIYKRIIDRYKLSQMGPTKFILRNNDSDVLKSLQNFLDVVKPEIDRMMRDAGREDVFISQSDFEEALQRVNNIKHSPQDSRSILFKSFTDWIADYKMLISNQFPELGYNELYKWEAIQHFQNNWTDDHDASNILQVLERSFNKGNNNLWSGQHFFPHLMLLQFAQKDGDTVSSMFKYLYNESIDLQERFNYFIAKSDLLLEKHFPNHEKNHYQSDRVLILYLVLRYPDKYFLYKSQMFKRFCELTSFWEFPRTKKGDTFTKVKEYTKMCVALCQRLEQDIELLELHKKRLPGHITFEDNSHLLTQDFIYAVATYLSDNPIDEDEANKNSMLKKMGDTPMIGIHLNQILYGPPGTGKTYNSISLAVSVIEGKNLKTVANEERASLKKRYDDYVNEGRIVFTTFHQSMSYEDFVEGIKPDTVNEEVIYEIKEGVFKRLCIEASFSIAQSIKAQSTITALDFSAAYDMFIDSLEETLSQPNAGVEIPTKSGGRLQIQGVSQKGNILIRHIEGSRQYIVSKARLKKLDLALGNLDDMSNIDAEIRAIIGGSNSSAYWAVLKVIRSLKPKLEKSENRIYSLEDKISAIGTLRKEDYATTNGKPYVLIIDEINRGNIAQIFGELITLIESDKRLGREEALEVTLPYSKDKFGVPANLHIIGTMNTADRSVEALDTALRRRFSFVEMPPLYDFEEFEEDFGGVTLLELIKVLNQRLEKLLSKDHLIGHSYFLGVKSLLQLKEVFQRRIIPLLQEYFYGDFGKIGLVLGFGFFHEVKDSSSDLNLFAEFNYYDVNDLLEKPVYRLKEPMSMSDDEFVAALLRMMRKNA